jgi:hypothetical protein
VTAARVVKLGKEVVYKHIYVYYDFIPNAVIHKPIITDITVCYFEVLSD